MFDQTMLILIYGRRWRVVLPYRILIKSFKESAKLSITFRIPNNHCFRQDLSMNAKNPSRRNRICLASKYLPPNLYQSQREKSRFVVETLNPTERSGFTLMVRGTVCHY